MYSMKDCFKLRQFGPHGLFVLWSSLLLIAGTCIFMGDSEVLAGRLHRVIVSTDIGGTDPDDIQSLVHLLAYADRFDLEGLISSPYGLGRKEHILEVIDAYEVDFLNLRSHSDHYPTPAALRRVTKQGAIELSGPSGIGERSEGSDWIIERARYKDSRPLNLLIWGGIEDLAQALHDAPVILPKLRVYWIGGPNKKWSVNAYHYVEQNHPELWMIEANSTYRGWFTGGNQTGQWGNKAFVSKHIDGHGALGRVFVEAKSDLKMGDTPSVSRLLLGTAGDPSQSGWGGKYVRAWKRPYRAFSRLTTSDDLIEQFGVFELVLSLGDKALSKPEMFMEIENQSLRGYLTGVGALLFRFSPKAAKTYSYRLRGNVPALNGQSGEMTSLLTPPDSVRQPSARLPNWWTDDPDPDVSVDVHQGAKTVNRWREAFLRDFALRMDRCVAPASK